LSSELDQDTLRDRWMAQDFFRARCWKLFGNRHLASPNRILYVLDSSDMLLIS